MPSPNANQNKHKRKNNMRQTDSNKPRSSVDIAANNLQPSLLWACPFYKQDPETYYRCLGKYELRRVNDVTQHVQRCHTRGKVAIRGMPRVDNEEEKWYRLWDSLFEGSPRPASPYVEEGIAEPIALLRSRADSLLVANLPSLLQDVDIQADDHTVLRLRQGIQQIIFEPDNVVTADVAAPDQAFANTVREPKASLATSSPAQDPPPATLASTMDLSLDSIEETVASFEIPQFLNQWGQYYFSNSGWE